MSLNVQSLVNKVDDVLSVCIDNDIDFGLFQETWFSSQSNATTAVIRNAGYNIVHNFREKRGGGVGIIYSNRISNQVKNCTVNKSLDTFQYQNLLFHGMFNINLMCIYRFQETSYDLFLVELNDLLSQQDLRHPLVLTGDFNVQFEKSNSKQVKDLIDLTSSFGLEQFVCGPSNKFGHTIDLLFANDLDFEMGDIEPINYNLGDHFAIFFDLPNISKTDIPQKRIIKYRDVKTLDIPGLASSLSTSLQSAFCDKVDTSNFSELLNIYNETVSTEFNNHAPLKTKTLTTSAESPPWLDSEYKSNRAVRRRLERKWKKSGLTVDKKQYVKHRELCSKMSNDKRSAYYHDLIDKKRGDQRALFNIVNNVLDKNKSRGVLPKHDNPVELANTFNQFYLNKVQQLRGKIPLSKNDTSQNDVIFNGTKLGCFRPTTVHELRKILKESGIKTSFNDILPANILKQVIEELLPHLCELVNKSLKTGSVEGIKESIVVPLLKKNGLDPDVLKNYRPVADLIFLSKLTERVVAIRCNEHMSLNNLHCKYEHGYKKHHSTETLLLRLVNDTLRGLDNNNAIILLLIDLSAAFDTVDIDILLHILESEIGISGTALYWLKSFLKDRNQRVKIENYLSESLDVEFGVPQGSVLGPILFNIYIRSLFEIIKKFGFGTSGYADDNNAYQSFALHFQYDVINIQLPTLMVKIKEWMNRHFLKINPDKTEIILFLPNSLKNEQIINGTFLEGDCIRFSNTVKNLGFTLDKLLNMEPHVNAIVSHCYKLISDVARIRHLLSDEDTESLMHAIVSSRIDYCNSLLYGVNKSVIFKLQKVQNAAARIISKRKKRKSVRDVLNKLHWLPVEKRIIFKLLVLTYKIIRGIAPECLSHLISIRNTDEFLLHLVYLNTTYGQRSFSYVAPRYWNALPVNIRKANSLESFKKLTKTLLFNNFETLKHSAFIYH